MTKIFKVRGIDPAGNFLETIVVADCADEAKTKAEEEGLKFVVVNEVGLPPS